MKTTSIALAALVGLALALPAAVGAATISTTTARGGATVGMTPQQQARYATSIGLHASAPYGCATVNDWEEVYLRWWPNTVVGKVTDTTRFCLYLTGEIVPGSVQVSPSLHVAEGFTSSGREVTVGYPFGYKTSRRNTCVLAQVDAVLQGTPVHWNLSGRIQIRGPQQLVLRKGDGYTISCYTNIAHYGFSG